MGTTQMGRVMTVQQLAVAVGTKQRVMQQRAARVLQDVRRQPGRGARRKWTLKQSSCRCALSAAYMWCQEHIRLVQLMLVPMLGWC